MMLNAAGAAAPQTSSPVPELGHLKAAAERLSNVNYNLATFYARFFGPTPDPAANAAQAEEVSCYRNDISSVFDQISRLEEMVNGLANIG